MRKILLMLLITIPALTACLDDGSTGQAGLAGPAGSQGIQGADGIQGATGATGPAGQDAPLCRMGVFIPGAYLLEDMDDGLGTYRHTTLLIIDTGMVKPAGYTEPVYGITVLDTSSGLIVSVARDSDGTLRMPTIAGSCLALPPAL